ncbi:MAG: DsbA family protein [Methylovirgula sp.]
MSQGYSVQKNRRQMLEIAIASGLTVTGLTATYFQGALHAEEATTIPMDELMAKESLPDIVQGKADAPITIIEYASMTCSHCAAFHKETWPVLQKNYIDTGKVRFILREFPLDPLATAGFMLARCIGDDKRNLMVDLLFDKQNDWAFTQKPLENLAGLAKQAGMSQETFNACINNQGLYDQIKAVRDRAEQKFGVAATPTFFVNGKKVAGEMSPQTLAQLLDPLLKKS